MNFTFDCIVIENNRAVRTNIVKSIDSSGNYNYQKLLDYFDKAISWLNKLHINGLSSLLKDKEFELDKWGELKYEWKNIYPEYLKEIENENINNDFILNYTYYIPDDLKDKLKKFTNLNSLSKTELDSIATDFFHSINDSLQKNKEKLISIAKRDFLSRVSSLSHVIYVNHDYHGYCVISKKIDDITFNWATNYGYGSCAFTEIRIEINGKQLLCADNIATCNIKIKRLNFNPPFSSNGLDEINECLADNNEYKVKTIKNQIKLLKKALKDEKENIIQVAEIILPKLISEKTELDAKLKEIEVNTSDTNYCNIKNRLDWVNAKIKLLEAEPNNNFSITSDANSVSEKTERIRLLKIEINFWIDYLEDNQDLLKKV